MIRNSPYSPLQWRVFPSGRAYLTLQLPKVPSYRLSDLLWDIHHQARHRDTHLATDGVSTQNIPFSTSPSTVRSSNPTMGHLLQALDEDIVQNHLLLSHEDTNLVEWLELRLSCADICQLFLIHTVPEAGEHVEISYHNRCLSYVVSHIRYGTVSGYHRYAVHTTVDLNTPGSLLPAVLAAFPVLLYGYVRQAYDVLLFLLYYYCFEYLLLFCVYCIFSLAYLLRLMKCENLVFLSYGYAALFSTPAPKGLSIYTPFKDNSVLQLSKIFIVFVIYIIANLINTS